MSDASTVKRALRSLADDPPARRPRPPVVTDGSAALADVRRAASFVAADGPARLSAAVDEAERRGDVETVREGRAVLEALEVLRRAARGDDHFHSARGTVLGRRGQGLDR